VYRPGPGGDLDGDILARLTPRDPRTCEGCNESLPYTLVPPALDKDFNDYYQRFLQHLRNTYRPVTEADLTPEERKDPAKAKEMGYTRLEAKDYVMREGDVVYFRFSV